MDTHELKLLAGQVREVLARRQHHIPHGHGLDFVAAIPGLRNWPEVMAFPDRVALASLDEKSVARLAARIARATSLQLDPRELLLELHASLPASYLFKVWPDGPKAGVYVTADPEAAQQAVQTYDAHCNGGALFFTDRIGLEEEMGLDLGEYGIFAPGMRKLPSGTLVVRGPLSLAQDNWEEARETVDMACQLALWHQLRVVLLLETSSPKTAGPDLHAIVSGVEYGDELVQALRGTISMEGEFIENPGYFAPGLGLIEPRRDVILDAALVPPANVDLAISRAFSRRRPNGLYVFGHLSEIDGTVGMLRRALAHTEDMGPACRVEASSSDLKKERGPDRRLLELPSVPSTEVAVARGYRRVFIDGYYGRTESILAASDRAVILLGTRDSEARSAPLRLGMTGRDVQQRAARRIEAAVCTTRFVLKGKDHWLVDAYYQADQSEADLDSATDMFEFLKNRSSIDPAKELRALLESSGATREDLKALRGARQLSHALNNIRFPRTFKSKDNVK